MPCWKFNRKLFISNLNSNTPAFSQDKLLLERRKLFSFQTYYWKQKSKENFWLKRDVNTIYFHVSATIKRNKNQIKSFISSSGNDVLNPNRIEHEITQDFLNRFTSNVALFIS